MRVNGYRCDNCSKEHLLEPTRTIHFGGEGVPADWFHVYQGAITNNSEPALFCSASCLYQGSQHLDRWFADRTQEVSE